MNDFLTSVVRTFAPMLAGLLVQFVPGVDLTAATLVISQMLWYLGARGLEQLKPQFGWLLALPKPPAYVPPDAN